MLAVVVTGGCNNVTDIVCPADPARVKVSPTSRTMNVGEQFTPTVTAVSRGETFVFARYTVDFGPLGGTRDSIRVVVQ